MPRICCHASMLGPRSISKQAVRTAGSPRDSFLLHEVLDDHRADFNTAFPWIPIFCASTQTSKSVILAENMPQLYPSTNMEEIELSETSSRQGDGEKKNAERKKAPAIVVFTSYEGLWATFAL